MRREWLMLAATGLVTEHGARRIRDPAIAEANGRRVDDAPTVAPRRVAAPRWRGLLDRVEPARFGPAAVSAGGAR